MAKHPVFSKEELESSGSDEEYVQYRPRITEHGQFDYGGRNTKSRNFRFRGSRTGHAPLPRINQNNGAPSPGFLPRSPHKARFPPPYARNIDPRVVSQEPSRWFPRDRGLHPTMHRKRSKSREGLDGLRRQPPCDPGCDFPQGHGVPQDANLMPSMHERGELPASGHGLHLPSNGLNHPQPLPTDGRSRPPPLLSNGLSHRPPMPSNGQSHPPPLPTDGLSHPPPLPSDGLNHLPPLPSNELSHPPPLPTDELSHPPPLPTDGPSQPPPLPKDGLSHPPPLPTDGLSRPPPLPTDGLSHPPPLPTDGLSHPPPLPTDGLSHLRPLPSNGPSHSLPPLPSNGLNHPGPWPSNGPGLRAPLPSGGPNHPPPLMSLNLGYHPHYPTSIRRRVRPPGCLNWFHSEMKCPKGIRDPEVNTSNFLKPGLMSAVISNWGSNPDASSCSESLSEGEGPKTSQNWFRTCGEKDTQENSVFISQMKCSQTIVVDGIQNKDLSNDTTDASRTPQEEVAKIVYGFEAKPFQEHQFGKCPNFSCVDDKHLSMSDNVYSTSFSQLACSVKSVSGEVHTSVPKSDSAFLGHNDGFIIGACIRDSVDKHLECIGSRVGVASETTIKEFAHESGSKIAESEVEILSDQTKDTYKLSDSACTKTVESICDTSFVCSDSTVQNPCAISHRSGPQHVNAGSTLLPQESIESTQNVPSDSKHEKSAGCSGKEDQSRQISKDPNSEFELVQNQEEAYLHKELALSCEEKSCHPFNKCSSTLKDSKSDSELAESGEVQDENTDNELIQSCQKESFVPFDQCSVILKDRNIESLSEENGEICSQNEEKMEGLEKEHNKLRTPFDRGRPLQTGEFLESVSGQNVEGEISDKEIHCEKQPFTYHDAVDSKLNKNGVEDVDKEMTAREKQPCASNESGPLLIEQSLESTCTLGQNTIEDVDKAITSCDKQPCTQFDESRTLLQDSNLESISVQIVEMENTDDVKEHDTSQPAPESFSVQIVQVENSDDVEEHDMSQPQQVDLDNRTDFADSTSIPSQSSSDSIVCIHDKESDQTRDMPEINNSTEDCDIICFDFSVCAEEVVVTDYPDVQTPSINSVTDLSNALTPETIHIPVEICSGPELSCMEVEKPLIIEANVNNSTPESQNPDLGSTMTVECERQTFQNLKPFNFSKAVRDESCEEAITSRERPKTVMSKYPDCVDSAEKLACLQNADTHPVLPAVQDQTLQESNSCKVPVCDKSDVTFASEESTKIIVKPEPHNPPVAAKESVGSLPQSPIERIQTETVSEFDIIMNLVKNSPEVKQILRKLNSANRESKSAGKNSLASNVGGPGEVGKVDMSRNVCRELFRSSRQENSGEADGAEHLEKFDERLKSVHNETCPQTLNQKQHCDRFGENHVNIGNCEKSLNDDKCISSEKSSVSLSEGVLPSNCEEHGNQESISERARQSSGDMIPCLVHTDAKTQVSEEQPRDMSQPVFHKAKDDPVIVTKEKSLYHIQKKPSSSKSTNEQKPLKPKTFREFSVNYYQSIFQKVAQSVAKPQKGKKSDKAGQKKATASESKPKTLESNKKNKSKTVKNKTTGDTVSKSAKKKTVGSNEETLVKMKVPPGAKVNNCTELSPENNTRGADVSESTALSHSSEKTESLEKLPVPPYPSHLEKISDSSGNVLSAVSSDDQSVSLLPSEKTSQVVNVSDELLKSSAMTSNSHELLKASELPSKTVSQSVLREPSKLSTLHPGKSEDVGSCKASEFGDASNFAKPPGKPSSLGKPLPSKTPASTESSDVHNTKSSHFLKSSAVAEEILDSVSDTPAESASGALELVLLQTPKSSIPSPEIAEYHSVNLPPSSPNSSQDICPDKPPAVLMTSDKVSEVKVGKDKNSSGCKVTSKDGNSQKEVDVDSHAVVKPGKLASERTSSLETDGLHERKQHKETRSHADSHSLKKESSSRSTSKDKKSDKHGQSEKKSRVSSCEKEKGNRDQKPKPPAESARLHSRMKNSNTLKIGMKNSKSAISLQEPQKSKMKQNQKTPEHSLKEDLGFFQALEMAKLPKPKRRRHKTVSQDAKPMNSQKDGQINSKQITAKNSVVCDRSSECRNMKGTSTTSFNEVADHSVRNKAELEKNSNRNGNVSKRKSEGRADSKSIKDNKLKEGKNSSKKVEYKSQNNSHRVTGMHHHDDKNNQKNAKCKKSDQHKEYLIENKMEISADVVANSEAADDRVASLSDSEKVFFHADKWKPENKASISSSPEIDQNAERADESEQSRYLYGEGGMKSLEELNSGRESSCSIDRGGVENVKPGKRKKRVISKSTVESTSSSTSQKSKEGPSHFTSSLHEVQRMNNEALRKQRERRKIILDSSFSGEDLLNGKAEGTSKLHMSDTIPDFEEKRSGGVSSSSSKDGQVGSSGDRSTVPELQVENKDGQKTKTELIERESGEIGLQSGNAKSEEKDAEDFLRWLESSSSSSSLPDVFAPRKTKQRRRRVPSTRDHDGVNRLSRNRSSSSESEEVLARSKSFRKRVFSSSVSEKTCIGLQLESTSRPVTGRCEGNQHSRDDRTGSGFDDELLSEKESSLILSNSDAVSQKPSSPSMSEDEQAAQNVVSKYHPLKKVRRKRLPSSKSDPDSESKGSGISQRSDQCIFGKNKEKDSDSVRSVENSDLEFKVGSSGVLSNKSECYTDMSDQNSEPIGTCRRLKRHRAILYSTSESEIDGTNGLVVQEATVSKSRSQKWVETSKSDYFSDHLVDETFESKQDSSDELKSKDVYTKGQSSKRNSHFDQKGKSEKKEKKKRIRAPSAVLRDCAKRELKVVLKRLDLSSMSSWYSSFDSASINWSSSPKKGVVCTSESNMNSISSVSKVESDNEDKKDTQKIVNLSSSSSKSSKRKLKTRLLNRPVSQNWDSVSESDSVFTDRDTLKSDSWESEADESAEDSESCSNGRSSVCSENMNKIAHSEWRKGLRDVFASDSESEASNKFDSDEKKKSEEKQSNALGFVFNCSSTPAKPKAGQKNLKRPKMTEGHAKDSLKNARKEKFEHSESCTSDVEDAFRSEKNLNRESDSDKDNVDSEVPETEGNIAEGSKKCGSMLTNVKEGVGKESAKRFDRKREKSKFCISDADVKVVVSRGEKKRREKPNEKKTDDVENVSSSEYKKVTEKNMEKKRMEPDKGKQDEKTSGHLQKTSGHDGKKESMKQYGEAHGHLKKTSAHDRKKGKESVKQDAETRGHFKKTSDSDGKKGKERRKQDVDTPRYLVQTSDQESMKRKETVKQDNVGTSRHLKIISDRDGKTPGDLKEIPKPEGEKHTDGEEKRKWNHQIPIRKTKDKELGDSGERKKRPREGKEVENGKNVVEKEKECLKEVGDKLWKNIGDDTPKSLKSEKKKSCLEDRKVVGKQHQDKGEGDVKGKVSWTSENLTDPHGDNSNKHSKNSKHSRVNSRTSKENKPSNMMAENRPQLKKSMDKPVSQKSALNIAKKQIRNVQKSPHVIKEDVGFFQALEVASSLYRKKPKKRKREESNDSGKSTMKNSGVSVCNSGPKRELEGKTIGYREDTGKRKNWNGSNGVKPHEKSARSSIQREDNHRLTDKKNYKGKSRVEETIVKKKVDVDSEKESSKENKTNRVADHFAAQNKENVNRISHVSLDIETDSSSGEDGLPQMLGRNRQMQDTDESSVKHAGSKSLLSCKGVSVDVEVVRNGEDPSSGSDDDIKEPEVVDVGKGDLSINQGTYGRKAEEVVDQMEYGSDFPDAVDTVNQHIETCVVRSEAEEKIYQNTQPNSCLEECSSKIEEEESDIDKDIGSSSLDKPLSAKAKIGNIRSEISDDEVLAPKKMKLNKNEVSHDDLWSDRDDVVHGASSDYEGCSQDMSDSDEQVIPRKRMKPIKNVIDSDSDVSGGNEEDRDYEKETSSKTGKARNGDEQLVGGDDDEDEVEEDECEKETSVKNQNLKTKVVGGQDSDTFSEDSGDSLDKEMVNDVDESESSSADEGSQTSKKKPGRITKRDSSVECVGRSGSGDDEQEVRCSNMLKKSTTLAKSFENKTEKTSSKEESSFSFEEPRKLDEKRVVKNRKNTCSYKDDTGLKPLRVEKQIDLIENQQLVKSNACQTYGEARPNEQAKVNRNGSLSKKSAEKQRDTCHVFKDDLGFCQALEMAALSYHKKPTKRSASDQTRKEHGKRIKISPEHVTPEVKETSRHSKSSQKSRGVSFVDKILSSSGRQQVEGADGNRKKGNDLELTASGKENALKSTSNSKVDLLDCHVTGDLTAAKCSTLRVKNDEGRKENRMKSLSTGDPKGHDKQSSASHGHRSQHGKNQHGGNSSHTGQVDDSSRKGTDKHQQMSTDGCKRAESIDKNPGNSERHKDKIQAETFERHDQGTKHERVKRHESEKHMEKVEKPSKEKKHCERQEKHQQHRGRSEKSDGNNEDSERAERRDSKKHHEKVDWHDDCQKSERREKHKKEHRERAERLERTRKYCENQGKEQKHCERGERHGKNREYCESAERHEREKECSEQAECWKELKHSERAENHDKNRESRERAEKYEKQGKDIKRAEKHGKNQEQGKEQKYCERAEKYGNEIEHCERAETCGKELMKHSERAEKHGKELKCSERAEKHGKDLKHSERAEKHGKDLKHSERAEKHGKELKHSERAEKHGKELKHSERAEKHGKDLKHSERAEKHGKDLKHSERAEKHGKDLKHSETAEKHGKELKHSERAEKHGKELKHSERAEKHGKDLKHSERSEKYGKDLKHSKRAEKHGKELRHYGRVEKHEKDTRDSGDYYMKDDIVKKATEVKCVGDKSSSNIGKRTENHHDIEDGSFERHVVCHLSKEVSSVQPHHENVHSKVWSDKWICENEMGGGDLNCSMLVQDLALSESLSDMEAYECEVSISKQAVDSDCDSSDSDIFAQFVIHSVKDKRYKPQKESESESSSDENSESDKSCSEKDSRPDEDDSSPEKDDSSSEEDSAPDDDDDDSAPEDDDSASEKDKSLSENEDNSSRNEESTSENEDSSSENEDQDNESKDSAFEKDDSSSESDSDASEWDDIASEKEEDVYERENDAAAPAIAAENEHSTSENEDIDSERNLSSIEKSDGDEKNVSGSEIDESASEKYSSSATDDSSCKTDDTSSKNDNNFSSENDNSSSESDDRNSEKECGPENEDESNSEDSDSENSGAPSVDKISSNVGDDSGDEEGVGPFERTEGGSCSDSEDSLSGQEPGVSDWESSEVSDGEGSASHLEDGNSGDDSTSERSGGGSLPDRRGCDSRLERTGSDNTSERKGSDTTSKRRGCDSHSERRCGDSTSQSTGGDSKLERIGGDSPRGRRVGDRTSERRGGDSMLEGREGALRPESASDRKDGASDLDVAISDETGNGSVTDNNVSKKTGRESDKEDKRAGVTLNRDCSSGILVEFKTKKGNGASDDTGAGVGSCKSRTNHEDIQAKRTSVPCCQPLEELPAEVSIVEDHCNERESLSPYHEGFEGPSQKTSVVRSEEYLNAYNERSSKRKGHETEGRVQAKSVKPESKDEVECLVCYKRFSSKQSLKKHIAEVHSEKRDYICSMCLKQFKRRRNLEMHFEVHREDYLYECEVCLMRFRTKGGLCSHRIVHSEEKPYPCELCEKKFKRSVLLMTHLERVHLKVLNYECSICGHKFYGKGEYRSHFKVHYKEQFECDICWKQLSSMQGLRIHWKMHMNKKDYKCRFCGKEFLYHQGWKIHEKRHQNDFKYKCETCGKKFYESCKFSDHMKTHGTRDCKCPYCDLRYFNEASVRAHIRNVHSEKEEQVHRCQFCQKEFNQKVALNIHIDRIHAKKEAQTCEDCGEVLPDFREYQKHRKVRHNDETAIVCNVCGKPFISLSDLSKHVMTHGDENKYECPFCPRQFKLEEYVRNHCNKMHGTSKDFKCLVCNKAYATKTQLDSHLKTHRMPTLACDLCDLRFKNSSSLERHKSGVHAPKKFSCEKCKAEFRTETAFRNHMVTHSKKKDHVCEHCGQGFLLKQYLTRHRSSGSCLKQYICPYCQKHFKKNQALTIHMRIHLNDRPYSCEVCGLKFKQSGDCRKHMARAHNALSDYKCNICTKTFASEKTLGSHMKKIHPDGKRRYRCEQCEESFNLLGELERHMTTHSGKMLYNCEQCGKSFNYKNSLTAHLLMHAGEHPFRCPECDRCFRVYQKMKEHLLSHNAEDVPYSFECEICHKLFQFKGKLTSHLKCHKEKKKTVPCSVCGKMFYTNSAVNIHMRIHTKEKPYGCELCGKRFAHTTTLEQHIRVHKGERPFSCSACGQKFRQMSHLKTHIQLVHKEKC